MGYGNAKVESQHGEMDQRSLGMEIILSLGTEILAMDFHIYQFRIRSGNDTLCKLVGIKEVC